MWTAETDNERKVMLSKTQTLTSAIATATAICFVYMSKSLSGKKLIRWNRL